MLWTPYERASTTDTSSEDEDEQLNRKRLLRKSKSHYDYTCLPTTSTTPIRLMPAAAAALLRQTMTTATEPARNLPTALSCNALAATSAPSSLVVTPIHALLPYAAANSSVQQCDLQSATATTPLVPFTILNPPAPPPPTPPKPSADDLEKTATNVAMAANCFTNNGNAVATNTSSLSAIQQNDIINNEADEHADAADGIANMTAYAQEIAIETQNVVSNYPHKLLPYNNNANSNSINFNNNSINNNNSNDNQASYYARIPGLSKWWITTAAMTTDNVNGKQPPSYESLYSTTTLQQNHAPFVAAANRSNANNGSSAACNGKTNLNIFKPILETLKANVTTITQRRLVAAAAQEQQTGRQLEQTNLANDSISSGVKTKDSLVAAPTASAEMTMSVDSLSSTGSQCVAVSFFYFNKAIIITYMLSNI